MEANEGRTGQMGLAPAAAFIKREDHYDFVDGSGTTTATMTPAEFEAWRARNPKNAQVIPDAARGVSARDELSEIIGYAMNNEFADPSGRAAEAILAAGYCKSLPIPDTAVDAALEARVAQELKKHCDTEYSWGKWYCECGLRLRSGYTQLAAHQREVEQKLREEAPRG